MGMLRTLTRGTLLFVASLLVGGSLPAQVHEPSLARAAEALEKGQVRSALVALRKAERRPRDPRVRQLFAVAYARIGRQEYDQGDTPAALRSYRKAACMLPDDLQLQATVGELEYRAGELRAAERSMRRLLKRDPQNSRALAVLGQVAADGNQAGRASEFFGRASQGAPLGESATLDRLADRFGRQHEAEQDFVRKIFGRFELSAPPGREGELRRVEGYLRGIEGELTRLLGRSPRPVRIVLYDRESFAAVSTAHHWAQAYYDGEVRINLDQRADLRSTLRHELGHAWLHEIYGAELPRWVHEGVAQLFDGSGADAAGSRFRRGEQLLRGRLFEEEFSEGDESTVARGYDQSLMLVHWLRRERGDPRFRSLLQLLGSGVSTDAALRQLYRLSLDQALEQAASQRR